MLSVLRTAVVAFVFLVLAPCAHAWTWPASGEVVEEFRNAGDPYAPGQHRGIDIAGEAGAPVPAPRGGVVSFAGSVPTHGLTVTIETVDSNLWGDGSGWRYELTPAGDGTDVQVTLTRVPKSFTGKLVGALIPLVGARMLGRQFQSVLRNAESR